jgi:prevent-host-death family protein
MSTWTLEKAKNQLSEVVRRALAHKPQIVTRGGRDAVVVLAREDYESLIAPQNLVEFLRTSPLAEAIANNALPEGAFDRPRDMGRDVDF